MDVVSNETGRRVWEEPKISQFVSQYPLECFFADCGVNAAGFINSQGSVCCKVFQP